jgi:hypothetical protein
LIPSLLARSDKAKHFYITGLFASLRADLLPAELMLCQRN